MVQHVRVRVCVFVRARLLAGKLRPMRLLDHDISTKRAQSARLDKTGTLAYAARVGWSRAH